MRVRKTRAKLSGAAGLKKAAGAERIPAAKRNGHFMSVKSSGVAINESVQQELSKVRDDLKLNYVFPWEKE